MTKHKNRSIIGSLVGVLLLFGCLQDSNTNLDFSTYEPRDIGDGLMLSNPENENVNSEDLMNLYNDVNTDENLWSLRSLLVFRNGRFISEAYFKDEEDITKRHIIWSMTKQVMGVLTGIAIDRELITDIDDPISDYFDAELDSHSDKENITIRNLITMQSGIDYSNDVQSDELLRQIPENSIDFVLSRPINSSQGESFYYNDGNPHLISGLIQKISGKPTDEWADDVLFSKIGMTNYNWVRYKDGVSLGGFGIETTPRELAKFAMCVADNGKWKGEQLIGEDWITDMTSPQVEVPESEYSFGYFWWMNLDRGVHFMWGAGGQFAFIVPDKNLVIVMTSYPNTKGEYEIQADEALEIVDAIISSSY